MTLEQFIPLAKGIGTLALPLGLFAPILAQRNRVAPDFAQKGGTVHLGQTKSDLPRRFALGGNFGHRRRQAFGVSTDKIRFGRFTKNDQALEDIERIQIGQFALSKGLIVEAKNGFDTWALYAKSKQVEAAVAFLKNQGVSIVRF